MTQSVAAMIAPITMPALLQALGFPYGIWGLAGLNLCNAHLHFESFGTTAQILAMY
jgi:hypothetical protein